MHVADSGRHAHRTEAFVISVALFDLILLVFALPSTASCQVSPSDARFSGVFYIRLNAAHPI